MALSSLYCCEEYKIRTITPGITATSSSGAIAQWNENNNQATAASEMVFCTI
jgi:hypothetical protein